MNATYDYVPHARAADAPLLPGLAHKMDETHCSTQPVTEDSGLSFEPDACSLSGLVFRRLGSATRLSSLCEGDFLGARGVSDALLELAEARSRADRHSTSSFADLPRADLIQSPPTALLLELAPTPRARGPHPTVGAYAFSIARGTSSSSLKGLSLALSEPDLRAHLFSSDPPYDITETPCFFDDFDGMENAILSA